MVKCEICDREFKNNTTLGQHVVGTHKITTQNYYDNYLSSDGDGICPICGGITTFISLTKGYHKFCSGACASYHKHEEQLLNLPIEEFKVFYEEHSDVDTSQHFNLSNTSLQYVLNKLNIIRHTRQENIKLSSLQRYGVESPTQMQEVKDRIKQTKLDRYGDENYNNFQKYKDTCIEKYGCENSFQVKEFKSKSKQTLLEKYGVDNPMGSEDIKLKVKQTKLDKYGDENYNNRDKAKLTTLDRYGVEVYGGSEEQIQKAFSTKKLKYGSVKQSYEEAQQKAKQTCLEKYGVEHYVNVKKTKQTKLVKYGDENYTNREQAMQTCIEKYGVPYPCIIPGNKEKSFETMVRTNMDRYGVPYTCLIIDNSCKKYSRPNQEFLDILQKSGLIIDDIENREFTLGKYAYDFKIQNTLIEINPSATHNSTWSPYKDEPMDKLYHLSKTQNAVSNGYRCINVWDWDDKEKIVNILLPKERICARNCSINFVSKEEEKMFLNTNHLQNYVASLIALGLYYNNELVSIMTFGKPRYNKNYEYELLRYCSSKNIVGGAERLFTKFIRDNTPASIISYCDNSKFSGEVYRKLNFTLKNKPTKPSKHWYSIKTKQHITDNLLRQRGFDQLLGSEYGCFGKGTNNEELMLSHGFVEIYDCGQSSYQWESIKN